MRPRDPDWLERKVAQELLPIVWKIEREAEDLGASDGENA